MANKSENKTNDGRLSELAGAWKMSNKEVDIFMKDLRKGWKKWKSKVNLDTARSNNKNM